MTSGRSYAEVLTAQTSRGGLDGQDSVEEVLDVQDLIRGEVLNGPDPEPQRSRTHARTGKELKRATTRRSGAR